jgi:hypothetical protein
MDQSILIAAITSAIAFFSLVFTVISSRSNDRKIEKISQSYFGLLHKAALSTASQKYVAALSKIKTEYDSIANELSKSSGEAFKMIYDSIDTYDIDNFGSPSLRHVYSDNINIVRRAYDFEFTNQPGLYLIDQLRALKYIERKDVLADGADSSPDFFKVFRRKERPTSTNEMIFQSEIFNKNLLQLYRRIPASSEPKVFSDAMKYAEPYVKLHESSRMVLRRLVDQMDYMERENFLEIFNIHEIPNLGENFRRIRADIKRLIELGLVDFLNFDQFKNHDGLSHLLYIGSVLNLANQNHSWGVFSDRMAAR